VLLKKELDLIMGTPKKKQQRRGGNVLYIATVTVSIL